MIKILSWNIHAYGDRFGAWEERLPLILETLREADPDIIALQAVRQEPGRAGGQSQAHQIAAALGGYGTVLLEPTEESAGGTNSMAVITRAPAGGANRYPLTRLDGHPDQVERILMHAWFPLAGGALHLFNTHLSWVDEQRERNLAEVMAVVNAAAGPRLLIGDFNLPPTHPHAAVLEGAGWNDAWRRLRPMEPGRTFYEDGALAKRIDYAWLSEELCDRLEAVNVLADLPDVQRPRPSDHAALMVTLNL